MYYRCELLWNGVSYDVTKDLSNWDDLQLAYKRSGMVGAVRSFTSQLTFVGGTYNMISADIIAKGLENDANVIIYLQNNSWTWNKIFECQLDLSSVKMSGYEVSFSCIDDTIEAKLKAKKSTKFEYPVSELATDSMLFNRIPMNNHGEYTVVVEETILPDTVGVVRLKAGYSTIPIYTTSDSIPIPGKVTLQDQEIKSWGYKSNGESNNIVYDSETPYFLRAEEDIKVRVRSYFVIYYGKRLDDETQMALVKFNDAGGSIIIAEDTKDDRIIDTYPSTFATLSIDQEVSMKQGEKLCIYAHSSAKDGAGGSLLVWSYKFDTKDYSLRVDWGAIGTPVSFDCVKPVTVLNALLKSICGSDVTGVIDDTLCPRLSRCHIAPAESIRAFNDAKLYTSFNDFCDFMEALFGFTYTIDGNTVKFLHRDDLFVMQVSSTIGGVQLVTDETKIIENATDCEISADSSFLYSTVEIGNDSEDYDEENGLFEFNFKQTYSTGKTFTSSTLSLTPQYRVDGYGIEYLVEKRMEDTTDDDSDEDVFAIYCTDTGTLEPDTTSVNVWYPLTNVVPIVYEDRGYMINAVYHPRYCIEANARYLSAITDKLTYASSDGDSNYMLGDYTLKKDVVLSEKRYTPFSLSFKTDDIGIPSNMNARIKLEWLGRTFRGWITSIKLQCTRIKEADYTLMLDSDSINSED